MTRPRWRRHVRNRPYYAGWCRRCGSMDDGSTRAIRSTGVHRAVYSSYYLQDVVVGLCLTSRQCPHNSISPAFRSIRGGSGSAFCICLTCQTVLDQPGGPKWYRTLVLLPSAGEEERVKYTQNVLRSVQVYRYKLIRQQMQQEHASLGLTGYMWYRIRC